MEFAKYFKKEADRSYRCTIPVKIKYDDDKQKERECNEIVSVSKDSLWNLKRHLSRKHDGVLREHSSKKEKGEHFELGYGYFNLNELNRAIVFY